MIDLATQITSLTSNQLLVAGVGTTIVAYAALQAKSVLAIVKGFVAAQTFSTLTARSNGTVITRLTRLVALHRLHAWGRAYSISEDDVLTIGYGSGIARWQGVWIWYNLRVDEQAKAFHIVEVLDLTFLTRDRTIIDRFVRAAALEVSTKDRDTIDIHHRANNAWHAVARKKRPIATVFANAGVTTTLVEKVRWFLANEAWYVRRGLTYKFVILLHGAPGTGKSSLIQAIASAFNRDLYCVDSLAALGPDIGRFTNGILAIEDIDTLGTLRRDGCLPIRETAVHGVTPIGLAPPADAPPSQKALLHGVLNTLDGLATPHGLITIITTNHIEALDPAMVRPCRIDLQLEVTALDYDAFRDMFASYFDGVAPDMSRAAYAPQTGARLQEIFMGAADASDASARVRKVCGGVREAA